MSLKYVHGSVLGTDTPSYPSKSCFLKGVGCEHVIFKNMLGTAFWVHRNDCFRHESKENLKSSWRHKFMITFYSKFWSNVHLIGATDFIHECMFLNVSVMIV